MSYLRQLLVAARRTHATCASSIATIRSSFAGKDGEFLSRNFIHGGVFVRKQLEFPQVMRARRFYCDGRPSSSFNVQDYDDFQERVLASETPVVVDFHAEWCGPCKMLGPRLESIVSTRDGEVVLAKVDIDENSDIAMDYDVRSVPTVLAVRDGEIVDKFVGLQEEEAIERFLDRLVGG